MPVSHNLLFEMVTHINIIDISLGVRKWNCKNFSLTPDKIKIITSVGTWSRGIRVLVCTNSSVINWEIILGVLVSHLPGCYCVEAN